MLQYIYTNTDDIGDNAEAKVGLGQHAVLLVAHVSSQTPITHNVFLVLVLEARAHLQSLPPPVRHPRQLSQAPRLLHQALLRHHLQLDREPLLTRVTHFLE